MTDHEPPGVAETARRVAAGETTARAEVEAALARIGEHDPGLNAFSVVLERQALAEAAARDAAQRSGGPLGPAPRRPDRHQGGARRRRHGDHVRRPRQQHRRWRPTARWSADYARPARS